MTGSLAWKKGCLGKAKYADAGKARAAKRILPYGKTLTLYQCDYCREWHLGTTNRTADGRAAKRTR